MRFTVVITAQAERDVDEIALAIGSHERDSAARWFTGLLDAMTSLEEMPRRCKRAAESDRFDAEIRQMNYGNYRVLFTIVGEAVRILHVRHAARRPLRRGDIDEIA